MQVLWSECNPQLLALVEGGATGQAASAGMLTPDSTDSVAPIQNKKHKAERPMEAQLQAVLESGACCTPGKRSTHTVKDLDSAQESPASSSVGVELPISEQYNAAAGTATAAAAAASTPAIPIPDASTTVPHSTRSLKRSTSMPEATHPTPVKQDASGLLSPPHATPSSPAKSPSRQSMAAAQAAVTSAPKARPPSATKAVPRPAANVAPAARPASAQRLPSIASQAKAVRPASAHRAPSAAPDLTAGRSSSTQLLPSIVSEGKGANGAAASSTTPVATSAPAWKLPSKAIPASKPALLRSSSLNSTSTAAKPSFARSSSLKTASADTAAAVKTIQVSAGAAATAAAAVSTTEARPSSASRRPSSRGPSMSNRSGSASGEQAAPASVHRAPSRAGSALPLSTVTEEASTSAAAAKKLPSAGAAASKQVPDTAASLHTVAEAAPKLATTAAKATTAAGARWNSAVARVAADAKLQLAKPVAASKPSMVGPAAAARQLPGIAMSLPPAAEAAPKPAPSSVRTKATTAGARWNSAVARVAEEAKSQLAKSLPRSKPPAGGEASTSTPSSSAAPPKPAARTSATAAGTRWNSALAQLAADAKLQLAKSLAGSKSAAAGKPAAGPVPRVGLVEKPMVAQQVAEQKEARTTGEDLEAHATASTEAGEQDAARRIIVATVHAASQPEAVMASDDVPATRECWAEASSPQAEAAPAAGERTDGPSTAASLLPSEPEASTSSSSKGWPGAGSGTLKASPSSPAEAWSIPAAWPEPAVDPTCSQHAAAAGPVATPRDVRLQSTPSRHESDEGHSEAGLQHPDESDATPLEACQPGHTADPAPSSLTPDMTPTATSRPAWLESAADLAASQPEHASHSGTGQLPCASPAAAPSEVCSTGQLKPCASPATAPLEVCSTGQLEPCASPAATASEICSTGQLGHPADPAARSLVAGVQASTSQPDGPNTQSIAAHLEADLQPSTSQPEHAAGPADSRLEAALPPHTSQPGHAAGLADSSLEAGTQPSTSEHGLTVTPVGGASEADELSSIRQPVSAANRLAAAREAREAGALSSTSQAVSAADRLAMLRQAREAGALSSASQPEPVANHLAAAREAGLQPSVSRPDPAASCLAKPSPGQPEASTRPSPSQPEASTKRSPSQQEDSTKPSPSQPADSTKRSPSQPADTTKPSPSQPAASTKPSPSQQEDSSDPSPSQPEVRARPAVKPLPPLKQRMALQTAVQNAAMADMMAPPATALLRHDKVSRMTLKTSKILAAKQRAAAARPQREKAVNVSAASNVSASGRSAWLAELGGAAPGAADGSGEDGVEEDGMGEFLMMSRGGRSRGKSRQPCVPEIAELPADAQQLLTGMSKRLSQTLEDILDNQDAAPRDQRGLAGPMSMSSVPEVPLPPPQERLFGEQLAEAMSAIGKLAADIDSGKIDPDDDDTDDEDWYQHPTFSGVAEVQSTFERMQKLTRILRTPRILKTWHSEFESRKGRRRRNSAPDGSAAQKYYVGLPKELQRDPVDFESIGCPRMIELWKGQSFRGSRFDTFSPVISSSCNFRTLPLFSGVGGRRVPSMYDYTTMSSPCNYPVASPYYGNHTAMSSGFNFPGMSSAGNFPMASSASNFPLASSSYNLALASSGCNFPMASSGCNFPMMSSACNFALSSSSHNLQPITSALSNIQNAQVMLERQNSRSSMLSARLDRQSSRSRV